MGEFLADVQQRTSRWFRENFKIAFGTVGKDPQIDPQTREVFHNQPTQYRVAAQPWN